MKQGLNTSLRASPAEALLCKISKIWSPKREKRAPAEALYLSQIYLALQTTLFHIKFAITLAGHIFRLTAPSVFISVLQERRNLSFPMSTIKAYLSSFVYLLQKSGPSVVHCNYTLKPNLWSYHCGLRPVFYSNVCEASKSEADLMKEYAGHAHKSGGQLLRHPPKCLISTPVVPSFLSCALNFSDTEILPTFVT